MPELVEVDIRQRLAKRSSKALYGSICMPSLTQSYSLCIEFAQNWLLNKFNPGFIKSVYLDGKNIFDEFRKLSKREILKRPKPAVAIVPSVDWSFDNDNVDSYPYGIQTYIPTGIFKRSFFKDHKHDVFLGIDMKILLMSFAVRIKFDTRPQQLDCLEFMKIAHRVGFTEGRDVDLDFHMPYPLMIQIAKDTGFEVIESETGYQTIKNVTGFLKYLNSHSEIPFMYKYRTVNGNNEFFIRMNRMYVHIRSTDISADDGEREGMTSNNYTIDFQFEVRFPCPKFYAYYSSNEHKLKEIYTAWNEPHGDIMNFYTFSPIEMPKQNDYGWHLYMETTYDEEMPVNSQDHKLIIDFSDLFCEGDIGRVIRECIDTMISPAIFLELRMINGANLLQGKMDWETLTYTSDTMVRSPSTYIGVYVDLSYLNSKIIEHNDADKSRLTETVKESN